MKVRNPTCEISLPKKLNLSLNLIKPLAPTTDLQGNSEMIPWRWSQQDLSYGEVLGTSTFFFFLKPNCEEQKKRKERRKLELIVMLDFIWVQILISKCKIIREI